MLRAILLAGVLVNVADVVNRAADGVQQRRAAARDILPIGQRLDPPDVDAVVDDLALVGKEYRRNKRVALSGLLLRNHRVEAADRVLFQPRHGTAAVQNENQLRQILFHGCCSFQSALSFVVALYPP